MFIMLSVLEGTPRVPPTSTIYTYPVADAVKGPCQLFSSGFVFLVCVFFGIPLFQYTAIVGLFVTATVVVFGIVFVVVFVVVFVGLFVAKVHPSLRQDASQGRVCRVLESG